MIEFPLDLGVVSLLQIIVRISFVMFGVLFDVTVVNLVVERVAITRVDILLVVVDGITTGSFALIGAIVPTLGKNIGTVVIFWIIIVVKIRLVIEFVAVDGLVIGFVLIGIIVPMLGKMIAAVVTF